MKEKEFWLAAFVSLLVFSNVINVVIIGNLNMEVNRLRKKMPPNIAATKADAPPNISATVFPTGKGVEGR